MKHSGFAGQIGVAREDITPPVGIFCRNWGAAVHDAAEGIHRPLTLTALTLQEMATGRAFVFVDTDLGWWAHGPDEIKFRRRLLKELNLDEARLVFAMSHTHSAPPLAEPEPQWQGGELLPAFMEKVYQATVKAVRQALATAQPAVLEWHTGRCALATNRDLPDGKRVVCGYNPAGEPDDAVVVGRATTATGSLLATLVNYACHPTTLAWDNKLISPDYLGAMRETMQQHTGVPAMFLQGASGELAPRYQYIGDPAVADAHGRQLAFAALATLADMENPGEELVFDRVVESGAPLATWKRVPCFASHALRAAVRPVELVLKDLPATAELQRLYDATADRAMKERCRRKLRIREGLGDGKTVALKLWCWRVGDAVIIGTAAEAYSRIQRRLRARFPDRAIVWVNLINGSIGYLAPAELYDQELYQVWQSPFERGSLEQLEQAAVEAIENL